MNRRLRNRLEKLFVGKKSTLGNVETAKNEVITFLRNGIAKGEIISYRNVSVRYFDRVLYIEYETAPVEPFNFVLITGHFYSDSITV